MTLSTYSPFRRSAVTSRRPEGRYGRGDGARTAQAQVLPRARALDLSRGNCGRCKCFRLAGVELGNGDGLYLGDGNVEDCQAWGRIELVLNPNNDLGARLYQRSASGAARNGIG